MTRTDILFQSLHNDGLLMLANCWDPASARIADAAGAKALATSSAAVAWSHGYTDGSTLPTDLLLSTVKGIARVSALPLSIDVEDGYASDPERVAALISALMAEGVVGINIEDGSEAPELLCRKITAIRAAADAAGVQLYINARTDVYLRGLVEPAARVAETIRRAALYREAGASGLFAAGVSDNDEITAIVQAIGMPLNVLARQVLASPQRLAELGVRRLSAGSAPAEAMFGRLSQYMQRFLLTGEFADSEAMPYGELNALMNKSAGR